MQVIVFLSISFRKAVIPQGYIATASPAKFPEALEKADIEPVKEGVNHLEQLPTRCQWMRRGQDWFKILCEKIEDITTSKKEAMKN